jgi:hypothetical protein
MAFLNAGALSHTLKFTIAREDIERIKTLVESSPEYRPSEEFQKWPFVDDVATANNKDDLESAFEPIYDGRNKAIRDMDLIPAHRIRPPGVKVHVEYTVHADLLAQQRNHGTGFLQSSQPGDVL